MSKYFVVQTRNVFVDLGADGESTELDVQLIPCEDSRAVCQAILAINAMVSGDWHLFEMVNPGRAVARAIIFKRDNNVPYDVEIS